MEGVACQRKNGQCHRRNGNTGTSSVRKFTVEDCFARFQMGHFPGFPDGRVVLLLLFRLTSLVVPRH
jgi:hypothetical protein